MRVWPFSMQFPPFFFLSLSLPHLLLAFYPPILCSDRLCRLECDAIVLSKPALRSTHIELCFIMPRHAHLILTCASGKEISVLQFLKRTPGPWTLP